MNFLPSAYINANIVSLISQQLGLYVDGVSPENLEVAWQRGNLTLKDLRLRQELLDLIQVPLQLNSGTVSQLRVVLPVSNLFSLSGTPSSGTTSARPLLVEIDGVTLVASPKSSRDWTDEALLEQLRLQRRGLLRDAGVKLLAAEARRQINLSMDSVCQAQGVQKQSWMSRIASRLVQDVRFHIKAIHLRFEDPVGSVNGAYSCGIRLDSLELWTPPSHSSEGVKQQKSLKITDLRVYWNSSQLRSPQKTDYVLHPFSCSVSLIFNAEASSEDILQSAPSCPIPTKSREMEEFVNFYGVDVQVLKLNVSLRKKVLEDATSLIEAVTVYQRLSQSIADRVELYWPYRPDIPVLGHAGIWWKYAVGCVVRRLMAEGCFTTRKRSLDWGASLRDLRIQKWRREFKDHLFEVAAISDRQQDETTQKADDPALNKFCLKLPCKDLLETYVSAQQQLLAEKAAKQSALEVAQQKAWFSTWFARSSVVTTTNEDDDTFFDLDEEEEEERDTKLSRALVESLLGSFALSFQWHLESACVEMERSRSDSSLISVSLQRLQGKLQRGADGRSCFRTGFGGLRIDYRFREGGQEVELLTRHGNEEKEEELFDFYYQSDYDGNGLIVGCVQPLNLIFVPEAFSALLHFLEKGSSARGDTSNALLSRYRLSPSKVTKWPRFDVSINGFTLEVPTDSKLATPCLMMPIGSLNVKSGEVVDVSLLPFQQNSEKVVFFSKLKIKVMDVFIKHCLPNEINDLILNPINADLEIDISTLKSEQRRVDEDDVSITQRTCISISGEFSVLSLTIDKSSFQALYAATHLLPLTFRENSESTPPVVASSSLSPRLDYVAQETLEFSNIISQSAKLASSHSKSDEVLTSYRGSLLIEEVSICFNASRCGDVVDPKDVCEVYAMGVSFVMNSEPANFGFEMKGKALSLQRPLVPSTSPLRLLMSSEAATDPAFTVAVERMRQGLQDQTHSFLKVTFSQIVRVHFQPTPLARFLAFLKHLFSSTEDAIEGNLEIDKDASKDFGAPPPLEEAKKVLESACPLIASQIEVCLSRGFHCLALEADETFSTKITTQAMSVGYTSRIGCSEIECQMIELRISDIESHHDLLVAHSNLDINVLLSDFNHKNLNNVSTFVSVSFKDIDLVCLIVKLLRVFKWLINDFLSIFTAKFEAKALSLPPSRKSFTVNVSTANAFVPSFEDEDLRMHALHLVIEDGLEVSNFRVGMTGGKGGPLDEFRALAKQVTLKVPHSPSIFKNVTLTFSYFMALSDTVLPTLLSCHLTKGSEDWLVTPQSFAMLYSVLMNNIVGYAVRASPIPLKVNETNAFKSLQTLSLEFSGPPSLPALDSLNAAKTTVVSLVIDPLRITLKSKGTLTVRACCTEVEITKDSLGLLEARVHLLEPSITLGETTVVSSCNSALFSFSSKAPLKRYSLSLAEALVAVLPDTLTEALALSTPFLEALGSEPSEPILRKSCSIKIEFLDCLIAFQGGHSLLTLESHELLIGQEDDTLRKGGVLAFKRTTSVEAKELQLKLNDLCEMSSLSPPLFSHPEFALFHPLPVFSLFVPPVEKRPPTPSYHPLDDEIANPSLNFFSINEPVDFQLAYTHGQASGKSKKKISLDVTNSPSLLIMFDNLDPLTSLGSEYQKALGLNSSSSSQASSESHSVIEAQMSLLSLSVALVARGSAIPFVKVNASNVEAAFQNARSLELKTSIDIWFLNPRIAPQLEPFVETVNLELKYFAYEDDRVDWHFSTDRKTPLKVNVTTAAVRCLEQLIQNISVTPDPNIPRLSFLECPFTIKNDCGLPFLVYLTQIKPAFEDGTLCLEGSQAELPPPSARGWLVPPNESLSLPNLRESEMSSTVVRIELVKGPLRTAFTNAFRFCRLGVVACQPVPLSDGEKSALFCNVFANGKGQRQMSFEASVLVQNLTEEDLNILWSEYDETECLPFPAMTSRFLSLAQCKRGSLKLSQDDFSEAEAVDVKTLWQSCGPRIIQCNPSFHLALESSYIRNVSVPNSHEYLKQLMIKVTAPLALTNELPIPLKAIIRSKDVQVESLELNFHAFEKKHIFTMPRPLDLQLTSMDHKPDTNKRALHHPRFPRAAFGLDCLVDILNEQRSREISVKLLSTNIREAVIQSPLWLALGFHIKSSSSIAIPPRIEYQIIDTESGPSFRWHSLRPSLAATVSKQSSLNFGKLADVLSSACVELLPCPILLPLSADTRRLRVFASSLSIRTAESVSCIDLKTATQQEMDILLLLPDSSKAGHTRCCLLSVLPTSFKSASALRHEPTVFSIGPKYLLQNCTEAPLEVLGEYALTSQQQSDDNDSKSDTSVSSDTGRPAGQESSCCRHVLAPNELVPLHGFLSETQIEQQGDPMALQIEPAFCIAQDNRMSGRVNPLLIETELALSLSLKRSLIKSGTPLEQHRMLCIRRRDLNTSNLVAFGSTLFQVIPIKLAQHPLLVIRNASPFRVFVRERGSSLKDSQCCEVGSDDQIFGWHTNTAPKEVCIQVAVSPTKLSSEFFLRIDADLATPGAAHPLKLPRGSVPSTLLIRCSQNPLSGRFSLIIGDYPSPQLTPRIRLSPPPHPRRHPSRIHVSSMSSLQCFLFQLPQCPTTEVFSNQQLFLDEGACSITLSIPSLHLSFVCFQKEDRKRLTELSVVTVMELEAHSVSIGKEQVRLLALTIGDLQVDNQLKQSVILQRLEPAQSTTIRHFETAQLLADTTLKNLNVDTQPFVDILICQKIPQKDDSASIERTRIFPNPSTTLHLCFARAIIMGMVIRVDFEFVTLLKSALDDLVAQWTGDGRTVLKEPEEVLPSPSPLYVQRLILHPLVARVSASPPPLLGVTSSATLNLLIRFLSSVGSINDVPFVFTTLHLHNASFPSSTGLLSYIKESLLTKLWAQSYMVATGADLLGNPLSTVSLIGAGLSDLVTDPMLALLSVEKESEKQLKYQEIQEAGNPATVLEGLGKGAKSLWDHTLYGTFNAVCKVSGAAAQGLNVLSLDDEHAKERHYQMQSQQPRNAIEGLTFGAAALRDGFAGGVRGLIEESSRGAEEGGFEGLLQGVGRGVVGALIKPVAGALEATSLAAKAIQSGAGESSGIVRGGKLPKRAPRCLYGSECLMRPYSQLDSKVLTSLRQSSAFRNASKEPAILGIVHDIRLGRAWTFMENFLMVILFPTDPNESSHIEHLCPYALVSEVRLTEGLGVRLEFASSQHSKRPYNCPCQRKALARTVCIVDVSDNLIAKQVIDCLAPELSGWMRAR